MAKVKLNGASVISGTIGGQVYSRNRGGAYIRSWVKPVNPNTPAQSLARQKFSGLSSDWKGLTSAQRATWNTGTNNFPRKDRIGETIFLSGQQLFMSFNRNQQSAGNNPIQVCPAPIVIPAPTFVGITVDSTQFTVGFTPDPLGTNSSLIIECSVPVSAGISFQGRSSFKQISVVAGATVSPADIFTEYNTVYGAGSLQTGAKVFIRMHIVDRTSGIASDSIQAGFVVA